MKQNPDVLVNPTMSEGGKINFAGDFFCRFHPNMHFENPKNPTENDQKKIERIRLKTRVYTDEKTGKQMAQRWCPKCFRIVATVEESVLGQFPEHFEPGMVGK